MGELCAHPWVNKAIEEGCVLCIDRWFQHSVAQRCTALHIFLMAWRTRQKKEAFHHNAGSKNEAFHPDTKSKKRLLIPTRNQKRGF